MEKVDFKNIANNVIVSIENKKEVDRAIIDTLRNFPNYSKEYLFLRFIQLVINENNLSEKFKLDVNTQINLLLKSKK